MNSQEHLREARDCIERSWERYGNSTTGHRSRRTSNDSKGYCGWRRAECSAWTLLEQRNCLNLGARRNVMAILRLVLLSLALMRAKPCLIFKLDNLHLNY